MYEIGAGALDETGEAEHGRQLPQLTPTDPQRHGKFVHGIPALAQHLLEAPGPRHHEPGLPCGTHVMHNVEQGALAAIQVGHGADEKDSLRLAGVLRHTGSTALMSSRPFEGA
jgi:hypothetical protein